MMSLAFQAPCRSKFAAGIASDFDALTCPTTDEPPQIKAIVGIAWLDESSEYSSADNPAFDDDVATMNMVLDNIRSAGIEPRIGFVWPIDPLLSISSAVGGRAFPSFVSIILASQRPVGVAVNLGVFRSLTRDVVSDVGGEVLGLAESADDSGSVDYIRDLRDGILGLDAQARQEWPNIEIELDVGSEQERWIANLALAMAAVLSRVPTP